MPPRPRPPFVDGRQARWDDHNADRRVKVLEAALAVLEEQPIGADLHVQQIAERAGLVRTVVYRHFEGRSDLNRAVQQHLVGKLRVEVEDATVLSGTAVQMIERIVGAYVGWVAAHPKLYDVVERELGDGKPRELDLAIQDGVDQFSDLIRSGAALLGVTLSAPQAATLDLLVVGLIGQVRGTVRHWVRQGEQTPPAPRLTKVLSQWIWFQIDGQARELGVELDPDLAIDSLIS